jgi:predicted HTH domain antitoxin
VIGPLDLTLAGGVAMFTNTKGVNTMSTITVSMRIPKEEAERLDRLAALAGLDRASLLKRSLRRGTEEVLFDLAREAYRRGEASLSKAAEMADISLREFLLRMAPLGTELNYSVADLERDLLE